MKEGTKLTLTLEEVLPNGDKKCFTSEYVENDSFETYLLERQYCIDIESEILRKLFEEVIKQRLSSDKIK